MNTNQTRTDSVKSWIKSLESKLNDVEWKACPYCGEEWTKLKYCYFYWNEARRDERLGICCAESVDALDHVNQRYPIPGISIAYHHEPRYRVAIKAGEYFTDKTRKVGVVSYTDDLQYLIRCSRISPYVIVKNKSSDEITFHDHILSAWSKINEYVTKGEDPTKGTSWGKV